MSDVTQDAIDRLVSILNVQKSVFPDEIEQKAAEQPGNEAPTPE